MASLSPKRKKKSFGQDIDENRIMNGTANVEGLHELFRDTADVRSRVVDLNIGGPVDNHAHIILKRTLPAVRRTGRNFARHETERVRSFDVVHDVVEGEPARDQGRAVCSVVYSNASPSLTQRRLGRAPTRKIIKTSAHGV